MKFYTDIAILMLGMNFINDKIYFLANSGYVYYCIPYNEETNHLVGTREEAPEFYRYW